MVAIPLVDRLAVDAEDELVALARHDRQEFAALYRRYLPDVYRYCYRRLGSREAAEDATSQVFVRALAALPRYQDRGGSFRAWLFTIARHVVIDEARRARPVASLDDVAGVDPTPGPDDLVIRSERGWTLAAAMRRLPPTQRQVIELRLAGLTAVEIAAVIDRSHGTVRNLQHRALVRLRGLLGVSDANQGAGDGS